MEGERRCGVQHSWHACLREKAVNVAVHAIKIIARVVSFSCQVFSFLRREELAGRRGLDWGRVGWRELLGKLKGCASDKCQWRGCENQVEVRTASHTAVGGEGKEEPRSLPEIWRYGDLLPPSILRLWA
jgi:hypothetical protein